MKGVKPLLQGGAELSGFVTVVRGTPADDLQDHKNDIGKQESNGDGIESNARSDALFKVLAQEEEDELRLV